MRLRGVFTALVTPFRGDGALDLDAFDRLVERQLAAGVAGVVPCATTGEGPALDDQEWDQLVALTVNRAKGRALVIPGAGTNNTPRTVAKVRRSRDLGADAALVVTPYYNKPNPDGLVEHYRQAASVGLPVVLYNVPGRTGLNAAPEQVLRIARTPGVVGVKEASGSLGQAMAIIEGRAPGFALLSGEDELTAAMTLLGGDGVISVISNVDPKGAVGMVEAALSGDLATARAEHYRMLPLVRALFAETNPVPCKAALALLRLAEDVVRPPLAPASEATRGRLADGLRRAGLME